ncbi:DUF5082 family protein [Metabacillus sp. KIGAM252]|uniref:DUF5082 family protein n=1 Tax=Metabacillus flavus TaxID=2823519 RepID=A0ABS5LIW8_9BACI|nr:DUF5082 family protein [Metabacillus flavus]MBS2970663.1 DUF5082 family protein [Metabacillus flavus]
MSLSALNAKLRDLEEKLQRLRKCSSELSDHQFDFFSSQNMVTEPDLTAKAWYGERSNDFNLIRENDMHPAYKDIQTTQFNQAFQVLSQKIQQITAEINSVKAAIASLEAEERSKAIQAAKAR